MTDEEAVFPPSAEGEEDEIISISDLMSGLMVVFLFIAVVFLNPLLQARQQAEATAAEAEQKREQVAQAQERVRNIVVAFRDIEERLADRLASEFTRDELMRWGAEFDRTSLTIRFRAPDVLFPQGQRQVPAAFRPILQDFLPRYTAVLWEFRDSIDEVRVEGHTSSEWSAGIGATEAFFRNMALSQDRTRAVLELWLAQPEADDRRNWLRQTVTANGLASSRLRLTAAGEEDRDRSRRVEFRVATRARERVLRVLEEVGVEGFRP